jgi:hypothetical protein
MVQHAQAHPQHHRAVTPDQFGEGILVAALGEAA